MRLEQHSQATVAEPLARGVDRGRDLGRMMAVVVDDRHTARLLDLEAPARAGEAREDRCGLVAPDACELERGERGSRVAAVVLARQREAAVPRRGVADDMLG